jgi:hypothetical protein
LLNIQENDTTIDVKPVWNTKCDSKAMFWILADSTFLISCPLRKVLKIPRGNQKS